MTLIWWKFDADFLRSSHIHCDILRNCPNNLLIRGRPTDSTDSCTTTCMHNNSLQNVNKRTYSYNAVQEYT